MANRPNQQGLFENQTHVLNLEDADVRYTPEFMSIDDANALYQRLLSETEWRQEQITVYGKVYPTPRLSCWMGDAGLSYAYSNMTMTPVAWTDTLLEVKAALEAETKERFNSVLINYYRDGQDSNGWHSDDEPELGRNPVIASISLGAPRDFHLRHKKHKTMKHRLTLENGSLLMMRAQTQHCWQHHVPKRANADGRINLTFREVK